MTLENYYAVAKGVNPGIYRTWEETKVQVKGYSGARYKKFATEKEAQNFISQHEIQPKTKNVAITNFFVKQDPQENEHTIIVFTDGSCLNNGMKNCRAGYGVCFPEHRELDFSESIQQGTNNRAEYSALIKAAEFADLLDDERKRTLVVYTDSMLLINTITKWINPWRKNGWKKRDGFPVMNLDLVKQIYAITQYRKVSMNHVKAHTGETTWEAKYNDIADRLAKTAARDNFTGFNSPT